MFKLLSIAAVVALLSACSGMSTTSMGSSGMMTGSKSSSMNNGDGPN